MKDKPLNYRQSLYVVYFTSDKECKGNAYKSAIKAGYTERTAQRAPEQLSRNIRIKAAIEEKNALIMAQDGNSREFVTQEMLYQYVKNKDKRPMEAIRALENLGKNCGWYALDNAQRTEIAKLTEEEEKHAHRIARVINLGLDQPHKAQEAG